MADTDVRVANMRVPIPTLLPPPVVAPHILSVRGQRVILDADLAALYGVPTKRFNEAVKRNAARFPADFMFALSATEWAALRSQSATSSAGHGGRRYAPRVFTEHGALMAATILSSARAFEVSVYVVRAFVQMRELAATQTDLASRLRDLELKTHLLANEHDSFSEATREQFKQVVGALRQLMAPPNPPKRPIGFVTPEPQPKASRPRRKV